MSFFLLSRARQWPLALTAAALVGACQEPTATVDRPGPSTNAAADFSQASATVAWNQVARDLVVKHRMNVPASIRMFALLSVAQ